MNPESISLYDSNKHFWLSSIPTVEVNVVSSARGDDNLSVTSRSVEKIPMKSVPHYKSIFEGKNNAKRLRWSNHVSI